jgi:hypothetical protein
VLWRRRQGVRVLRALWSLGLDRTHRNDGLLILMRLAVPVYACVARASRALSHEPKALVRLYLQTRYILHELFKGQTVRLGHVLHDVAQPLTYAPVDFGLYDRHDLLLHGSS